MNREEQIAERRKQMPTIYRGKYDRAMTGKSRKEAIDSFCIICCNGQWSEITRCSDEACPLYLYRPYKTKTPPVSRGVLALESTRSK